MACLSASNVLAFSAKLQGQSFGSTNWSPANVTGWAELDAIPMRVFLTDGPATAQTITVRFDHTKSPGGGIVQGIQNLFSFTPSDNVAITSGPTLNAPPGDDVWSYTFTINLTNNAPGFVEFRARLSAGAHNFTGASLSLGGSPALGIMSIIKPAPAAGNPDLSIVKLGPTNVNAGATVNYSISYQNKLTGTTATGVQVVDMLPSQVTFVSCTGGCDILGNTITWDLGDLARGASGVLTYQVVVTNVITTGFSFHNDAAIASAENDANPSNNFSSVTTVVTSNCVTPSIVAEPSDAAACAGDSMTFSVIANGSAPLHYQWRKDGVDIAGATSSALTLDPLVIADAGDYDVVISNLCGIATSTPATLVVNSAVIVSEPVDTTACVDDSVAFLVEASGNSLTYQWRKDSADIAGATNNLYDIESVSESDAGDYDVVVTGTCGGTTSTVATLTLNVAPLITEQPFDTTICEGDMASLSVGATGTGLSYQWRKDGEDIVGANTSEYSTSEAGSYDVIVTGTCGAATSATVTVTVNLAPAITDEPEGATICAGDSMNLSVGATGTDLTYQWRKDGEDITGATSTSLTVSEAGAYDVVVSGACAPSAVSSPVNVVVKPLAVAVDDSFVGSEDSSVSGNVLDNDTGGALTAELVSGPAHGSLDFDASGAFTYTPNPLFHGADSFTYRAVNDCGASDPATVSLEIGHVNHAPVAEDDSYGTLEDTELNVPAPGVLANDSDVDGDTLEAIHVVGPSHGVVTLNADGSFLYTPLPGFFGTDSFTCRASDGQAESADATVTIEVTHVNHAPVAEDDSLTIAENSGTHAIDALANDSDPDGDALTITEITQPANGEATMADGGAGLTYTPNANFTGVDTFTYTISDGNSGTATATVTVTVEHVAVAPVAQDDSYEVEEDDTLVVAAPGVMANDINTESSALTATKLSDPAHGSLTFHADGSFTYVPNDNYSGPDSFTYKVNNGFFDSNVATVHIDVLPIIGASDVDLYVKTAKAKLNRADENRDTLSLRGQINPRGIKDNLSGATISVEINGLEVLTPQTLDARGKAASTAGSLKVKCQLKGKNGAYGIKVSGANLREAFGLPNQTEAGVTVFIVRLTINDADLEIPVTVAHLESPFRTVADKSTSLKFSFRKNRTMSGVFNANKTAGATSKKGETVSMRGVLEAEDAMPVIPNGDITILIANADITLPLAALTSKGTDGSSVWSLSSAVDGVTKFSLANKTHTFTLVVSSSAIGLPAVGGPMKYDLPLQIRVPTAHGLMFFESIIELKRSSDTSTRWKR